MIKTKLEKGISFLLMSINIFLTLPYILFNIYRKKETVFIIALFFAGIGFFFTPIDNSYDLARYYESFNNTLLREQLITYQKDIYAEYLIKVLMMFDLNKRLLPAISAFIVYYYMYKSLELVLDKKNISRNIYLCIFIITYFITPIIGYTGIRFYPALFLNCYGILLYLKKNDNKGLIYIIISILVHMSFILSIIMLIISKILYQSLNSKIFKILSITIIIKSLFWIDIILINIVEIINSLNIIYITPTYITGSWGIAYGTTLNLMGKFLNIYLNRIFILMITFYYIIFIFKKEKLDYYIILILTFSTGLLQYTTISIRYFTLAVTILYFSLILKYFNYKKKEAVILGLIILFLRYGINFVKDIKLYSDSLLLSYLEFYNISYLNILKEIFLR